MIVLAIDTTSEHGSLAVRIDGETCAERGLPSADGFAHLIFPAIEEICRSAGVRFAEIDCFAAASGPGSFTGVRVGLAAVKGLAEALGKSVAAVSNLRALSCFGTLPLRAVAMDTGRGDVYAAVYDAGARLIVDESAAALQEWMDGLPMRVDQFVIRSGDAQVLDSLREAGVAVVQAPQGLAAAVAVCAEIDWRAGKASDPAAVDANYVRPFSARKQ